jgi:hypothetical protein
MSLSLGRTLPYSVPRRLIGDLLYFARGIPSVPVQRRINVAGLWVLRAQSRPRMRWCTLFTRAYGLVSAAMPELRRAYLPWPRPHLYEHPSSLASVAVEREYQGESAILFGVHNAPEKQSLVELDTRLRRFKDAPIESIGSFRHALFVSGLPLPVRRLAWWLGLNLSGDKRARRLGTFGVSVYSGLGAESLHPLSPLTTTLSYGVIQPDGSVDVRITYDHRVMDGPVVARALARLETVLNEEVANELRSLSQSAAVLPPLKAVYPDETQSA